MKITGGLMAGTISKFGELMMFKGIPKPLSELVPCGGKNHSLRWPGRAFENVLTAPFPA